MQLETSIRRAVVCGAAVLLFAAAGFATRGSQPRVQTVGASKFQLTPDVQAALDRISADSLRGHLSFIASDLLEGRDTPSRGLDIAAEYIAAQFRRAGLEPVGDDGYFQTAKWVMVEPNAEAFALSLIAGAETVNVAAPQITSQGTAGLDLSNVSVVKLSKDAPALKAEQVRGKVVVGEGDFETLNKLAELQPALLLMINRANATGRGLGGKRLLDPAGAPRLFIHDQAAIKLIDALPAGETAAKVSLKLPMKEEQSVKLRNVVGLLRGSDPVLKDTYVMVTAHYDHVGVRQGMAGDNIFNGANDDGSGTVSVIELASVLSTLKQRPKRSIIFMTVFGEEKGLLGSRYYGRHPIFPIEKTVADVNLEHLGRTDDTEGDKTNSATMTGFDYSDVGTIFKAAGELTGVNVYKHERNSDSFFGRSDNQALADQGVPAHTICVAFIFPDYHRQGDHWDKVNYPNLAKTNRMVAVGLLMIAENGEAPKWNEANPKAARYVQAAKGRRAN